MDASITLNSLKNMVGQVVVPRVIIFIEEKVQQGEVHNKALYVSTHYEDMCIPLILVDNGSMLNICTMSTLDSLGIPS